ncbi:hypothetical protein P280DRAFT_11827 [Massarina eburnea CBS 473.64]|uniref:F-box domain-containing protein n=1 Tax=Massarina eburnea CBS 473.64 TaxID=1395130 RepID=A0A6A6SIF9_9PLEO|nr:hypothetical protein P280DRAFT_11827 [Massarina eburnea CBS 473.64]
MGLSTLPDELLLEVVGHVSSMKDLKALALVSKGFTKIAQAALMPTIEIRGPTNCARIIKLLRTLLYRRDLASNVQDLALDVPDPYQVAVKDMSLQEKAGDFMTGFKDLSPTLCLSWTGVMIALLPSLKRLNITYRSNASYITGDYSDVYTPYRTSVLDALFLHCTTDDLARIPGLQSLTHLTIRGDIGDPLNWKFATLPKLRHLETPETSMRPMYSSSLIRILRQLSSTLDICPFADFDNLTRLKLTIGSTAPGSPAIMQRPITHNGSVDSATFATTITKLEPLARTLEELDIELDLKDGKKRLDSVGPMTSMTKFSHLKRLRVPQEALVSENGHMFYGDFPPHIEKLEIVRTTGESSTWVSVLLENARDLDCFKKLTVGFRSGHFPAIEAWYRARSLGGEPVLFRQQNGVEVMCWVEL